MKCRAAGITLFAVVLFAVAMQVAAAQETVIQFFPNAGQAGTTPYAGLISDAKGNLYGANTSGGGNGYGTIFELSPGSGGTWTETTLHSFQATSSDGITPRASLIFDAKGNLYGTTANGGSGSCVLGCGTVFELSPSGGTWTETILYSFQNDTADGANPFNGSLIFDPKGNLYGTTKNGGANGFGAVFELSPGSGGTWTQKVLYSFQNNGADGINPLGGVVLDAAGNLYGTTVAGGVNAYGTVFELSPAAGGTWTEKVLHSFAINGVDGADPQDGVILDAGGNLFGTTYYGGNFGQGLHLGAVFELSPNPEGTWTEQILYSFTAAPDGYYPVAGLIFDAAGNLYGTTAAGGEAPGDGTVFKLTRANGWKETQLHSFNGGSTDGGTPYSSLIFDAAGNLYGTTTGGGSVLPVGGAVYEIASVVTPAPTFSPVGGAYSAAQTVTISDAVAGATIYYTVNGSISPTQYKTPVKVSASETLTAYAISSSLPQSQPSVANYQIGTVAATPWFSPPAGTYTVAQSVTITDAAPGATIHYTTDGTTPTASSPKYTGPISVTSTETIEALAVASGYSNSAVGSAKYTIAIVTPPTENLLYSFGATSTDGGVPLANLVRDSQGNLYGTTKYGGANDVTYSGSTTSAGTAFELSPKTGGGYTEKIIYNFGASTSDGALPIANMVFDSKGNLYGTTLAGGSYGLGTAFELSPGTGGAWTEKIIYSFGVNLADAKSPEGGLVFDSKGNLYGTTNIGGTSDTTYGGGYGTVFELSPGTGGAWTETVLHNFTYLGQTDGYFPTSTLVFDANGNLYGTTSDGGTAQDLQGGGTVFELSPEGGGGWSEKILYNFGGGGPQGFVIDGGVVLDAAGNLYGTAHSGGNGFGLDGTLFELSPGTGGTWTFQVLHSFGAYDGDGINPNASLVLDTAGNLYGTTYAGGANGYGTVFEMSPQTGGGWFESIVHSFNLVSTDGANPSASLILDASGNLYGTTAYGGSHGDGNTGTAGGSVFEIVSSTTTTQSTTTTLVSSVNPSIFGQSVIFTATVAPQTSGTPTGTVSFKNGTATMATVTLSAGVAKYTNKTLAVGTHSIAAVYNGSASYTTSTSTAVSQVVNKASTTTAVVSSLTPSVFGESITFTATVTPQYSGKPAGTVTFKNGTVTLGSATLSAGVAAYTNTTLAVGTHSITAVYNGSTAFTTSTSTAISQVVTKAGSTTTLVSSGTPSVFGQPLTFTATVTPQFTGTLAGTVTFKNGTVTMATVTLTAGVATYINKTLAVGTHSITAVYNGSASFITSTSTAVSQVVTKASTTTALVSSANPSTVGESVTFTATVVPQFNGTPAGTVTFKNGTVTLGAVTLSDGTAAFTTATLAKGAHTITATYGGSSAFKTSSATLTQTVN